MTIEDLIRIQQRVRACLREWRAAGKGDAPKPFGVEEPGNDARTWLFNAENLDDDQEFAEFFAAIARPTDHDPDLLAVTVSVLLAIDDELWADAGSIVSIVESISHLVKRHSRNLPELYLRSPELVLAYFLGWCNRSFNADSRGLDGTPHKAHFIVVRYLATSVESCFTWLERRVDGFPSGMAHDSPWEARLLRRLTARRGGCGCWERPARENDRKKKSKTCIRFHHISRWNPVARASGRVWTLWRFLQKAVKGFVGRFQPGSFPSGMLWDLWQTDARANREAAKDRLTESGTVWQLLSAIIMSPLAIAAAGGSVPAGDHDVEILREKLQSPESTEVIIDELKASPDQFSAVKLRAWMEEFGRLVEKPLLKLVHVAARICTNDACGERKSPGPHCWHCKRPFDPNDPLYVLEGWLIVEDDHMGVFQRRNEYLCRCHPRKVWQTCPECRHNPKIGRSQRTSELYFNQERAGRRDYSHFQTGPGVHFGRRDVGDELDERDV
jgi:hypothetical protein